MGHAHCERTVLSTPAECAHERREKEAQASLFDFTCDLLVAHQVDAGSPMHSTAPITPRKVMGRQIPTNGHKPLAQFFPIVPVPSVAETAEPTFNCEPEQSWFVSCSKRYMFIFARY